MATFVLVHGAWSGGHVWRPNARALRQAGHDVYTPTLTGVGERSHLLRAGIDLDTQIADVLNVIKYEQLSDIVLCGHSYGGMVVTGVADAVPERISSLVYLDAFVPENGQALSDLVAANRNQPSGDGISVPPLPLSAFGADPKKAAQREALMSPASPRKSSFRAASARSRSAPTSTPTIRSRRASPGSTSASAPRPAGRSTPCPAPTWSSSTCPTS
jgi:pimeloyl-ACP methyl ester carboxylesterase